MAKQLTKDPFNIIITGVGGQGNVMASRVLANMLVGKGYQITIGETFGASQRGGSVMSHIRVSEKSSWSPQIPRGQADIVVALEPIDAIRVLITYGNPHCLVLTNTRAIYPVGVIAGELNYPGQDEIRKTLTDISAKAWFLDATEEALRLGNPILGNIIMIGATVGTDVLPVTRDDFKEVIARSMPKDKLEMNLIAFDRGVEKIKCQ
ncbi:MAG: indolepyruvate oxidoreductase subunit beta [Smithellaceae bacterium]|nr:indolepyruvate oxidoreductase subunit beta [Smithellaceae bacterium]